MSVRRRSRCRAMHFPLISPSRVSNDRVQTYRFIKLSQVRSAPSSSELSEMERSSYAEREREQPEPVGKESIFRLLLDYNWSPFFCIPFLPSSRCLVALFIFLCSFSSLLGFKGDVSRLCSFPPCAEWILFPWSFFPPSFSARLILLPPSFHGLFFFSEILPPPHQS